MMHVPFDLESRRRYLDQEFDDAEYDRRLGCVRANMEREGLDALVIYCGPSSYASARWLTNYQAFNGSCFVVVRPDGGLTVTTDGVLHGEPMHTMVWTCRVADLRCAAGAIYGGPPDRASTFHSATVFASAAGSRPNAAATASSVSNTPSTAASKSRAVLDPNRDASSASCHVGALSG